LLEKSRAEWARITGRSLLRLLDSTTSGWPLFIDAFILCVIAQTLLLSLEERDAEELILVLRGYHKLFTDRVLPIHRERTRWTQDSGKSLWLLPQADGH
jgi:hypothetical protein